MCSLPELKELRTHTSLSFSLEIFKMTNFLVNFFLKHFPLWWMMSRFRVVWLHFIFWKNVRHSSWHVWIILFQPFNNFLRQSNSFAANLWIVFCHFPEVKANHETTTIHSLKLNQERCSAISLICAELILNCWLFSYLHVALIFGKFCVPHIFLPLWQLHF